MGKKEENRLSSHFRLSVLQKMDLRVGPREFIEEYRPSAQDVFLISYLKDN